MSDLIPNVGAGTLIERTLLADDRAVRVGALQTLDYARAVVITHDKWKEEVGGIPQHAFLLATAREIGSGGGDDDEVLLLRVEGTAPLSLERDLQAVREEVNVYGLLGNKTGMFGMTRMGKSNTMKTVAARVFAVSERRRAAGEPPVGQLILDPQGEYANPNTQDGTELAAIGTEHVVIYKFGADGSEPNVRPLGINF